MQPDIICALHICTCFSAYPCKEHKGVIAFLVRYLLKTHHLGMRFAHDCTMDLNAMLMQVSVETGTNNVPLFLALLTQGLFGSSSMAVAPFLGIQNYKHRLDFLSLMLSTLLNLPL